MYIDLMDSNEPPLREEMFHSNKLFICGLRLYVIRVCVNSSNSSFIWTARVLRMLCILKTHQARHYIFQYIQQFPLHSVCIKLRRRSLKKNNKKKRINISPLHVFFYCRCFKLILMGHPFNGQRNDGCHT